MPALALDRLAIATRRSSVYEDVRALVISSALPPNTRIRVDDVARRIDAGGTPVREALFQLSAENLVTVRHQQGFWQPGIDRADLSHLMATKTALENLLLADAPSGWDDAAEQDLVLTFHRFAKLAPLSPTGSYLTNRSWLEGHRALHAALLAGSGNGWAQRMVETLNANIDRYRCYILGAWLGAAGESALIEDIQSINTVEAHRDLHDLAMARDFNALGAALRRHNSEALALLDRALTKLEAAVAR